MDFDALERLGRLRDSGAITPEEFVSEKRRILGLEPKSAGEPSDHYLPEEKSGGGGGRTVVIVCAAIAILGAAFFTYKSIAGDASDHVLVEQEMGSNASATSDLRPLYKVSSSVRGMQIAATSTLPKNPTTVPLDDHCAELVKRPSSSAAQMVASKGWHVTGIERLDNLEAVSFAGRLEPSTSSLCIAHDGNVAVFDGGRLQAIIYGENLGSITSIPNSSSVRIWDEDLNYQAPVADVVQRGKALVVERIAKSDRVCADRIPVPAPFNLPLSFARAKLLEGGWQAVPQPENDFTDEREQALRSRGIPEVEHCAGTGFAACYFIYRSDRGVTLTLRSLGEDDDPAIVSYEVACSPGD